MSFYFSIIGTKDNPLFEHEFGTSKQGGDGHARFRDDARRLNPFIVHSALDIVEELQWASHSVLSGPAGAAVAPPSSSSSGSGAGAMYLRTVDRFHAAHVAAFLTGGNVKFMLLSAPDTVAVSGGGAGTGRANAAFSSFNPTSAATEEAIKNFFLDVYDAWVKTLMNPFYHVNMPITSSVFRARVAAAAKKFL